MARYWKIYRTFFSSSLARELEFRVNFFFKALQNVIWILFFLLMLAVIYSNTESVAGWTQGEAYVLTATVFIMNGLHQAFFFSLSEIPQHIRQGTMDFVATKPVDSQFWISARRFNFDQVGTLVAGIAMAVWGVIMDQAHPSLLQIGAYIALVVCSLAIFYAFMLLLMTTAIWLVRVDNLWVLGESMTQIARYPVDIYSSSIKYFLTFGFPLAFIATMPASQLVRRFDPSMLGIGIVWAIVMLVISRWFWRYGMKHYTSASS